MKLEFRFHDGGREDATGRSKRSGDCVTRAIAIASQRSYAEVWEALTEGNATQRKTKRSPKTANRDADTGVLVKRKWFRDYMASLGFVWIPTMTIGSGCKVHLRRGELPDGRLVVAVSKHYVAVIDGVIHDTYDPSRGGNRCVYGFWKPEN